MSTDDIVLIFLCVVRLVAVSCVLCMPAPLVFKVVMIVLSDVIDCSRFHWALGAYNNKQYCKTNFYQKTDKICDLLVYIILMIYICYKNELSQNHILVLSGLLAFRLVGVILFLVKSDKRFMIYFPDLFSFILISMALLNFIDFGNCNSLIYLIAISSKMGQEYYLHSTKQI
jgi:hypothetical protein